MALHPAPDPPPRTADVLLRDPAPRRARVHWPARGRTPSALVVLFTDAPTGLAGLLLDRLGAVVLAVTAAHAVEAHATVAWAADHAAELDAGPECLVVVGEGGNAVLAERVAALAADEGWPPLHAVAAVWPGDDPSPVLDALARGLAIGAVR